ncbi:MAG: CPBP family intramembrane metalloprotease [Chitinophagaceae bacterium]
MGVLIAFVGVGLILAGIAQLIIGLSLVDPHLSFQQKLDPMLKALMKPENNFYLQLSQVVGTFFLMFIPAILYMWVCHGNNKLWLGFSPRINTVQVLLVFSIIMCATFAAEPLTILTKYVTGHFPDIEKWAQNKEDTYTEQALAIANMKSSWGAFFMALLIMAFLPAMFEEMLFRGALQNLLVCWWKRPVTAIIVTALLFSYIHGTVYSFLGRALLGFTLGWIYYRSKNLWLNIAAHFFNNAAVVIQLFMLARSNQKPDISKMDQPSPLWLGLLSMFVLYALFVLFGKMSVRKRNAIETDEQKLWIKSTPQYNLADTNNPFN